jgi:hypothetical protein
MRRILTRLVLTAALGALAPVATAAAGEHPKVQFTSAGQAAARAAGLKHSDVGSDPGWAGGAVTPNPLASDDCPTYHPKRSDLVLNGLAGVAFEHRTSGISFRTQTAVFQTPAMVGLFWRRSLLAPQLLPCVASETAATLPSTLRFVSIKRLVVPAVVPLTTGWRITLEVRATKARVFIDQISVARGRTEINFAATSYLAREDVVKPAEGRLIQALVSRMRL